VTQFDFTAAHHATARDRRLVKQEKLLLFVLLDRADVDGVCWPGLSDLAACTGMSRSDVKRARSGLKAVGALTWIEGGRERACVYTIQQPVAWNLSTRAERAQGPQRTRVQGEPGSTLDRGGSKENPPPGPPWTPKDPR
jgi:hypothetical protein